jgi:hypothetical protein
MIRLGLGMGWGVGLLFCVLAGVSQARQPIDICRIEAEADAIRCLADDLRPELRDHFHCSCLFRDLNRARNEVESAARRVRSAARSRARICDLPEEVACLAEKVNALQCLVDRARGLRADFGPRGLDPGCRSRVERILSEMCHRTHLLQALVGARPFGRSHFGGGHISGNWGSGWEPTWHREWGYREDSFSGPTNYGGTYFRGAPGQPIGLSGATASEAPLANHPLHFQAGREVERNRTVTRSRELQKLSRNR